MARRFPWLLTLCLVTVASAIAGACSELPDDGDVGSETGGPTYGVPPTLDTGHPGWTRPDCGSCHTLPVEGHTVTTTYSCANCHGANGACFPNGFNEEYNEHTPEDDCVGCHQNQHDFQASAVCQNCHFRELGQRECGDWVEPPPPEDFDYPPPGTAPQLSTELSGSCFGFPTTPYSATHHLEEEWTTELVVDDQAIEFSLKDVSGAPHALSELLKDKPVWLQTGSYSCPIYRDRLEDTLNPLARGENAAGPYADQIHFVHIYTVEAHPQNAYSPYTGKGPNGVGGTGLQPEYWIDQATTYDARRNNAEQVAPFLSGEELLLIDDLSPQPENDPVWCSYARCPSCSILISRDGHVKEVLHNNETDLETAQQTLDWFLELEAEAANGG